MSDYRKVTLEEASFAYREKKPIFLELSTTFATDGSGRGSCIAIMGPSGCGKTTLLKLLMGMLQPECGRVLRSPAEGYCSLLTQEPLLFEHYTRERNARYFATLQAVQSRFDDEQFQNMVGLLGLAKTLEDSGPVSEMSGGERQRLSLIRAMSVRPDFLMLDEPCTGMDRPVKGSFLTALRELIEQQGLLSFYATHHLEEAKVSVYRPFRGLWEGFAGREVPGCVLVGGL